MFRVVIVFTRSGQHLTLTQMSLNQYNVVTVYLTVLFEFSYGRQGHSLVSSELKLLILLSVKAGNMNCSHNVILVSGFND